MQLGGGSLLDTGVYPLFLVLYLLGEPDVIKSFAHISSTGADESMNSVLLTMDRWLSYVLPLRKAQSLFSHPGSKVLL